MNKFFLSTLLTISFMGALFSQEPFIRPVGLERFDKERFEKGLVEYDCEKRQDRRAIWMRRSAFLAGSVGVGMLGIAGMVTAFGLQKSARKSGGDQNGGMSSKTSVSSMFKEGLFFSLVLSLGALFNDSVKSLGGYFKESLWCEKTTKNKTILILSQRVYATLRRLRASMLEIEKQKEGSFLFNHYGWEIVDAFKVLVMSLESLCAASLYEVRSANGINSLVAKDCENYMDRFFGFCLFLAERIEYDLNRDKWGCFNDVTFELLNNFEQGCAALLVFDKGTPEQQTAK
jgi:hypothetical protein